jgi:hypothetical protein
MPVYLCAALYIANSGGDRQFSLVIRIGKCADYGPSNGSEGQGGPSGRSPGDEHICWMPVVDLFALIGYRSAVGGELADVVSEEFWLLSRWEAGTAGHLGPVLDVAGAFHLGAWRAGQVAGKYRDRCRPVVPVTQ